jgi:hypothetical protein
MTTILRDTGPTTLTKTWYVNGTATDVGDITIGIVNGAGTEVVAPLTATTNNADGTYDYNLAVQGDVSVLRATWTAASQSQDDLIEIKGGRLFSEAQARAFDNSALTNASTYPDADIAAERERVTELMEAWTGRSWVPRYCRLEALGHGGRELWLNSGSTRLSDGTPLYRPGRAWDTVKVIAASVNGTAVTVGNIEVGNGRLWRTDGVWTTTSTSSRYNVVVEFEYGLLVPQDGADRIGLLLARDRLVASNIPDRAISWSDELGTTRLATPGVGGAVSNIPEVNEWVRQHSVRIPVA